MIVESPAKAKTIARLPRPRLHRRGGVGHIRDLPHDAADVPGQVQGRALGPARVDVDHDFEPSTSSSPDKKAQVAKLKSLLKDADELYLATDEDREGEAIAWHLLEMLKPKVPVKRMVFHEITKDAIQAAADSPRELDSSLVDAQETRRILDRLYGYEVSPVLWKKVMPGALGRPRAVGGDPAGGGARAGAHGVPARPPTGT